jgi:SAM-dependent methyltransferase
VVLRRVVELALPQPAWRALDVGTGTGNTAFALAPAVAWVVGIDLTPEMLSQGERLRKERGFGNVNFEVGDVHRLPYRAAHHFSDIGAALAEMRRVLRPGGRLVIDDRSVPEDDRVDRLMQELDTLHDPSHVRQYRPSEWRALLDGAGFSVETVEPYTQHRPLTSLTDGVGEAAQARIAAILDGLDAATRAAIDLREVDGELHSTHWYVLLSARRAADV